MMIEIRRSGNNLEIELILTRERCGEIAADVQMIPVCAQINSQNELLIDAENSTFHPDVR